MSRIYQKFNTLHHCQSQLYLVRRERVSAKIAQALVQWDKSNKEVKVSRLSEDKNSPTLDKTEEAMAQMTRRMLDAHKGKISWSLWNKKQFEEKDHWVLKPSTEQLRRWKVKVAYLYTSLGDEVAHHPHWLLKSFEATLST